MHITMALPSPRFPKCRHFTFMDRTNVIIIMDAKNFVPFAFSVINSNLAYNFTACGISKFLSFDGHMSRGSEIS